MRTDIEQRIASAFSDLEPSAAVEEAVRGGLGAQQARGARPPAVAWLLPVAAVVALGVALVLRGRAVPDLADEGEGAPALPVVARPPTGVAPAGEEWTRVRLCRDGRILVPEEAKAPARDPADPIRGAVPAGWRQVSLDELAGHLERAAQAFDAREQAAGRSGYERLAAGVLVSRLRVDLFADRDAPWRQVQWILLICAERRMPRVAFAVDSPDFFRGRQAAGALKLDASLPVDPGVLNEEPNVRVSVLVRSGPPVRYVIGNQGYEELASVARQLVDAREAAAARGAPVRGEVKAGGRVPFSDVAKVLAEFRQAGFENVDFYGTPLPDDDVREAARLPTPGSDWPRKKEAQESEEITETEETPGR